LLASFNFFRPALVQLVDFASLFRLVVSPFWMPRRNCQHWSIFLGSCQYNLVTRCDPLFLGGLCRRFECLDATVSIVCFFWVCLCLTYRLHVWHPKLCLHFRNLLDRFVILYFRSQIYSGQNKMKYFDARKIIFLPGPTVVFFRPSFLQFFQLSFFWLRYPFFSLLFGSQPYVRHGIAFIFFHFSSCLTFLISSACGFLFLIS